MNYSAQNKPIEQHLRLIAVETKNKDHKRILKMAAEIIEDISTIKGAEKAMRDTHKAHMAIVDRIAADVPVTAKPKLSTVYVNMGEDKIRTAYKLLDHIDGRRNLYRWPNGRMRMLREYSKAPPNAEFLGLFDDSAKVGDLIEAIS